MQTAAVSNFRKIPIAVYKHPSLLAFPPAPPETSLSLSTPTSRQDVPLLSACLQTCRHCIHTRFSHHRPGCDANMAWSTADVHHRHDRRAQWNLCRSRVWSHMAGQLRTRCAGPGTVQLRGHWQSRHCWMLYRVREKAELCWLLLRGNCYGQWYERSIVQDKAVTD